MMAQTANDGARILPATPWGLLPPRLNVLYITTPRRTGGWLAEAFASDSACRVSMEEAVGAAAGLARLRDLAFDAILVSHEPPELDALELIEGLRGSGAEEPTLVLGPMSEQEMTALCYEVGADAYVCASTATIRTLLWTVARATEHRRLIRENRRLSQAERHRRDQDSCEAQRMLSEQRGLIRDSERSDDLRGLGLTSDALQSLGPENSTEAAAPLDETIVSHYRQLLRAHVIMGSGNLASEMNDLAERLAKGGTSAAQTLQLHVQVLEELVHDLGNRGARHVMTRGDLLVLEMLAHLTQRYRARALRSPVVEPCGSAANDA
jgi:CheY-like chemotaxis protein